MTNNPLWIHVLKWEKFQHYKDRHPPWIKVYTRLLQDTNYLKLSHASRGLLQLVWLAYAEMDGVCTIDDLRMLGRHRVYMSQLDALNHAGFIDLSASKLLAIRSTETEKEIIKDLSPAKKKAKAICPECGAPLKGPKALAEHAFSIHDGPYPEHWDDG